MTNIEIINALNGITKFTEDEKEPCLTIKGLFALHKNKKILLDNYKVYVETLEALGNNPDSEKIQQLLQQDVNIDIVKITQDDFLEGTTFNNILSLEFMIQD